MLIAVCHEKGSGWNEVDDLSRLSDLREKSGNVLWAETDVANLTEEDMATIAEEFGLHPLAVEDAIHARQRPKFEKYEGHLFGVFHQLDEEDGQFEAKQIACFIGERFVLVLHDGASRSLDAAKKRAKEHDDFDNPAFLVHTMLDAVVDDYQEKADRMEEQVEDLEEIVLATPDAPVQRQLYSLKQRTARLRRYVFPGARLLEWAVDPNSPDQPFSKETTDLFRDVHDHLVRMTDQIKNTDDIADAVLELVRSQHAIALNEVNKKLAAWAAIFAVGTLIAGIYGMNFKLVPRDQTLFGFWFAVGLMVALSVGLYLYFKRRGWL